MLEKMLQRYEVATQEQGYQALREVMQEVALAGLYRAGFFKETLNNRQLFFTG